MENEFATPAKQLVTGVQSSNATFVFGVKTPLKEETITPPALMEQQSNIMKTIKGKDEDGEGGVKTDNHPERVKVPLQHHKQLWAIDGRYMSPTDRIMSPVTQILLARNKKAPLPPSKVLDGSCKESGPSAP